MDIIDKHSHHAEVFEMSAGQVFYWPSNRWHVATTDGGPSVVVQLSAYFNPADVG